jgi:hypothetical protein
MGGVNRYPWEYSPVVQREFTKLPKVDMFIAWLEDLMTIHEGEGWTEEKAITYMRERCLTVKKQR